LTTEADAEMSKDLIYNSEMLYKVLRTYG